MHPQGTTIDGRTAARDGLQVRGTDLVRLIGHVGYTAATLRLMTGTEPAPAEIHRTDRYLADTLAMLDPLGPLAATLTGRAALAVRLLSLPPSRVPPAGGRAYAVEGDLLHGLQAAAVAPVLACRPAQGPHRRAPPVEPTIASAFASTITPAVDPAAGPAARPVAGPAACPPAARPPAGCHYVDALFTAILDRPADSVAELNVFDALLVAWHAGFGTLLPTIAVPRLVGSTGASAVEALAAGVLAGGKYLVGGSAESLRFLEAIQLAVLAGTDLERAVELQIARTLASGGVVHGTGHPLLVRDPRPARLRAVARQLGARLPLQIYDEVVERLVRAHDLHPNIDLASAAILLALDLTDGAVATGLAVGARAFCMLAHVAEQRAQPSFAIPGCSAG